MRFLSRSCLLLLAAGLCANASATNVYQWKDAKGVLHSSDKPPPGQKYETRRITTSGEPVAAAEPAKADEAPECTAARRNLELLQGSGPLMQDTNGDGKPDTQLDDAQRSAQKQLAEAAAAAYCKK